MGQMLRTVQCQTCGAVEELPYGDYACEFCGGLMHEITERDADRAMGLDHEQ